MGETFLTVMREGAGAVRQSIWMTTQSDPGKEKARRRTIDGEKILARFMESPQNNGYHQGRPSLGRDHPSLAFLCCAVIGWEQLKIGYLYQKCPVGS